MPDLFASSGPSYADVRTPDVRHVIRPSPSSRLSVVAPTRPPQVVELVGPAGAGKTTLRRALAALEPRAHTAVRIDRRREFGVVMHTALRLLVPVLAGTADRRGAPSWGDAVQLVRLRALRPAVDRLVANSGQLVLLDEGPVYALAKLEAYSGAARDTGAFGALWRDALARWRPTLDVIVWLDAPDELLVHRIRARAKAHRIKMAATLEAACFLSRYREAYGTVVARFCTPGGPRLLRIDTASGTPAEQAVRLTAALEALQPRACVSSPPCRAD